MARPRQGKCPKCSQVTPLRSGTCLYCGGLLDGAVVVDEGSDEAPATLSERRVGTETRSVLRPGGERDRGDATHEEPRMRGGAPRFQRQTDTKGHWLVTSAGQALALDPGKLFVIGRDPRSSLVIRTSDVSRKHAEIDWRGDPPRPLLNEVRSRFGTFVNGAQVRRDAPEPLRDRDEVRLGSSFTFIYRHANVRDLEEGLENEARDETREIRLRGGAAAPAPIAASAPLPAGVAAAAGVPGMPPAAPGLAAGMHGLTPELAAALGIAFPQHAQQPPFGGAPPGYPPPAPPGYAAPASYPGYGQPPNVGLPGGITPAQLAAALGANGLAASVAAPPPPAIPPELAHLPPELLASMGLLAPRGPAVAPAPPPPLAAPPPAAPPAPQHVPDEGDLSAVRGNVLLEALHRDRRSGTLTIYCAAGTGEIVLSEGRAKKATIGSLSGREALEMVAQASQGAYRFRPETPSATLRTSSGTHRAVDDWSDPPQPPPTERTIPADMLGLLRSDSQRASVLPLKPTADPGGPAPPLRPSPPPFAEGPLRQESTPEAARRPATKATIKPGSPMTPPPRAPGTNPLRPPTQQVPPGPNPLKPPTQQMRAPGSPPPPRPGTRPVATPSGAAPRPRPTSSGEVPVPQASSLDPEVEAAAGTLLGTIRAAGVSGEPLGQFVGDAVAKLLEQGLVAVAIEVGDRGLQLAERDGFEAAIAARIAFKAIFRNGDRISRALALLEVGAATQGRGWASALAARVLALVDPEVPPDPKDPTPLGKIAALARPR